MGRVVFMLGAAGSGKTSRCLREIATEAAARPDGPPLLLLVPEQATFQMERALLAELPARASLRAQVLGFQRLGHRVAELAGGASRPRVGERGREALLEVALRRAGPLHALGGMVGRPGLTGPVAACLRELAAWRQSPQSLRAAADRVRGTASADASRADALSGDAQLADKLEDLAAVWSAHRALLHGRFTDPDGLADLACERLAGSGLAAGARVWVDGFAGFTPQELGLLVELAASAERTAIALCVPADARPERPAPGDLFHPTRATYVQVHGALAARGLAMEPPVRLARAIRFAASPALAHAERHLRGAARRATPPPAAGALSFRACPDRRAEAEAAAAEIVALCRDRGYRYRDVAVLTRDLDAYLPDLEDALDAEGIPYFADHRRPLRQHPLAALCRAALAVAADGWPTAAVLAYLKTDLSPLDRDEADVLERAAVALGIQGAAWLRPAAWRRSRPALAEEPEEEMPAPQPWGEVEDLRRRAVAPLRRLARELGTARSAEDGIAALRRFLGRLDVAARLLAWDAEGPAPRHAAVGEATDRLLDELAAALGSEPLELAELRAAVVTGLDGLSLGLIPPTADQVLLGEVERSRQPRLRALLLLGATEDAFPRAAAEDGVFPDGERARLRAAGAELAPGTADRIWDEPYLAYIAMTRAAERLYISWPIRADGRPLRAAAAVRDLLAVFPDAEAGPHEPPAGAFPGWLLRALTGGEGPWRQYLPAYAALRADPDLRRRAAPAFAALGYENEATPLRPELAAALFTSPVRMTATRLAAHAACPFQHFAAYGLRLRRGDEPRLDAPALGALLHDALAHAVRQVLADGVDLGGLDDVELAARCEAAVARQRPALEAAGLEGPRLLRTETRLRSAVTATMHAARDEAAEGRFRPVAIEREFVEELPGGARLVGKIDRVDAAGPLVRVVDYKSRPRPFHPADVDLGLEWQLPLYLGAAGGEPAAMLYQPAQEPMVATDGPLPPDEAARRSRGALRASGLLSRAALEASGIGAGLLPVRLRQDGQPTADSSVADPAELAGLLAATRRAAAEVASRVAAGDIAIRPWRRGRETACQRCLYAAVCRFDPRIAGEGFRELD